jgi:hypothetical protein
MVCPACHKGKHEDCRGGTWCDCQHRPPTEIQKMNEESTTSSKLIDPDKETKNV